MSELEEKLQSVLSDPQQMSQIMALAQSLGASLPQQTEEPQSAPQGAAEALHNPMLQLLGTAGPGSGKEARLFDALRPIVSERGQSSVDRAIRAARLSRLAALAVKNAAQGGQSNV